MGLDICLGYAFIDTTKPRPKKDAVLHDPHDNEGFIGVINIANDQKPTYRLINRLKGKDLAYGHPTILDDLVKFLAHNVQLDESDDRLNVQCFGVTKYMIEYLTAHNVGVDEDDIDYNRGFIEELVDLRNYAIEYNQDHPDKHNQCLPVIYLWW